MDPNIATDRTKLMMLAIKKLWLAKRRRSMSGSFTRKPELIKATNPNRLKLKQEMM